MWGDSADTHYISVSYKVRSFTRNKHEGRPPTAHGPGKQRRSLAAHRRQAERQAEELAALPWACRWGTWGWQMGTPRGAESCLARNWVHMESEWEWSGSPPSPCPRRPCELGPASAFSLVEPGAGTQLGLNIEWKMRRNHNSPTMIPQSLRYASPSSNIFRCGKEVVPSPCFGLRILLGCASQCEGPGFPRLRRLWRYWQTHLSE